MSNFSANIQARLDLTKIPNDIAEIEKKRVNFNNLAFDKSKLISDIQSALDNHKFNIGFGNVNLAGGMSNLSNQMRQAGSTAGNSYAGAFRNSASTIETYTNNAQNSIQKVQRLLASSKFDRSSIDIVTQDLEHMNLEISKIVTNINNDRIRLSINGIDEMGRAVTIIKDFNHESGNITSVSKTIAQSFDTSADGAKRFQKEVDSAYRELISLQGEIGSLEAKKFKFAPDTEAFKEVEAQLVRKKADFNEKFDFYEGHFSDAQYSGILASIDESASKEMLSLASAIDKLDKEEQKLADTTALKEQKAALSDFLRIEKEIASVKFNLAGLDESSNPAEIEALQARLNALGKEWEELNSTSRDKLSTEQLEKLSNAFSNAEYRIAQLNAKLEDTRVKLASGINNKIENGSIDASIAKAQGDFSTLNAKIQNLSSEFISGDVSAKINQIKTDLAQLNQLKAEFSSGGMDNDALITSYTEFSNVLSRVKNNLATVSSTINVSQGKLVDSVKATTLSNQMSTWIEKNSKAVNDYGAAINALTQKLNTLNSTGKLTEDVFKGIEHEFKEIKQDAISAGKSGRTLIDTFKKGFGSIVRYFGAATIITKASEALREMANNVIEVDRAMTELRKVTNETSESYDKFLSNAGSVAKEVGTSVKGLINSTADFARLGYNFEDAQELAKVANIYAVVGDEIENVDEATKSIISTLAAYKGEITDAMQIVDKFNEVGNNFAISSGGIGDALQRSASSLVAANNSLDQSIALITAANTVVQDPASVGTALKTKFL